MANRKSSIHSYITGARFEIERIMEHTKNETDLISALMERATNDFKLTGAEFFNMWQWKDYSDPEAYLLGKSDMKKLFLASEDCDVDEDMI
jgi:hypothetical protein